MQLQFCFCKCDFIGWLGRAVVRRLLTGAIQLMFGKGTWKKVVKGSWLLGFAPSSLDQLYHMCGHLFNNASDDPAWHPASSQPLHHHASRKHDYMVHAKYRAKRLYFNIYNVSSWQIDHTDITQWATPRDSGFGVCGLQYMSLFSTLYY